MNVLDSYRAYRSAFENPASILLQRLFRRKNIRVKFSDGVNESVPDFQAWIVAGLRNQPWNSRLTSREILEILRSERIPYRGRNIVMHGLSRTSGDVGSTFLAQVYSILRVEKRVVFDIGANIGDSSVYFALEGAIKVVALEPVPASFELATRNVEENGLGDCVKLVHLAYGPDGLVNVPLDDTGTISSSVRSGGGGVSVQSASLGALTRSFEFEGEAALKLDAEGAEYHLLSEPNAMLRRFNTIFIEYHFGDRGLKNKLVSAGFEVTNSSPSRFALGCRHHRGMRLGYIFARRVDYESGRRVHSLNPELTATRGTNGRMNTVSVLHNNLE